MIKVGTVQMSCTKEPKENLSKAIVKIREAAAQGAQIVCLQELFTSLYFCDVEDYDNFKLAEPVPGPSTIAMSELARELGVVIIADDGVAKKQISARKRTNFQAWRKG